MGICMMKMINNLVLKDVSYILKSYLGWVMSPKVAEVHLQQLPA